MTDRNPKRFALLAAWMAEQGIGLVELAGRCETSKSALHRLLTGQVRRADPELAAALFEVTGGRVGPAEIHAFLAPAKVEAAE